MQKIAIFTESSQSFGMGHLMRMRLWREIILSYAQKNNMDLECDLHIYDGQDITKAWFYQDNLKSFNGDLAIIDSYQAPYQAYALALKSFKKVAIIDDINRITFPKECFIINGAPNSMGLYGDHPHVYAGIEYQAIHPVFSPSDKKREKQILLTFGGSDEKNFTQKCFDLLAPIAIKLHYSIHIILGPHYPYVFYMHDFEPITKIHQNCTQDQIASLFQNSLIIITAGGVMLNEALATKANIIGLITADNQSHQVNAYAKENLIIKSNLENLIDDFKTLECSLTFKKNQKINNLSLKFGKKIEEVLQNLL